METLKRLPNLIIAGVVKGGTTSLFSYLAKHPQICSSSIKETCYFHGLRYGYPPQPLTLYENYFLHCRNEKYIMEATPGYFEGGERLALGLKKTLREDIRVIIVLREPVDRLMSFFRFKKSMLELEKEMTIQEYISYCDSIPIEERKKQKNDKYWGVDGGYYDLYLESWMNVFDQSIKIFFFDDLKRDPYSLLLQICNWLNIDYGSYTNINLESENKSIGYRNRFFQKFALSINSNFEVFWRGHPNIKSKLRRIYQTINSTQYRDALTPEIRTFLEERYRPHNQAVSRLLTSRGYSNIPSWLSISG